MLEEGIKVIIFLIMFEIEGMKVKEVMIVDIINEGVGEWNLLFVGWLVIC